MRILIITGGHIDETFAAAYIRKYQPEYVIAADRRDGVLQRERHSAGLYRG